MEIDGKTMQKGQTKSKHLFKTPKFNYVYKILLIC